MSVGSLGMVGSLAGTPLAQAKGSEIDRAKADSSNHERQTEATDKAIEAAGIGRTQEDSQAGDRDADGRRIWEIGPADQKSTDATTATSDGPHSKDPTGQAGQLLDLDG
ncbi:MAG TPA: hypothetical protein VL096_03575 [Pirellulaceae bacterium]|nr:hypothetical protein [Pirellulaceae bacterium]